MFKGWYFQGRFAYEINTKLPPILHNKLSNQFQFAIVKVHGVFPSSYYYSASSRKIQFHWACTGDSRKVVTSFMRDGTYPSRSFATLGPSEYSRRLLYLSRKLLTIFVTLEHRADVRPYISYYYFAKSCVFIKQSLFLILCYSKSLEILQPTLSRGYSVILPSSFNTVVSRAWVFSTSLPVSVYSTIWCGILFLALRFKVIKVLITY